MATLAAAEMVFRENIPVHGLYTIGEPRVGNSTFASNFDRLMGDKTFRFENNNDIVPRLPFWGPILTYTHVGKLIYIDSNGKLNDSISWLKHFADRLVGEAKDIGHLGLDDLKDHHAAAYVKSIADNRTFPN